MSKDPKSTSPESLVQASAAGSVELSETELDKVSGGDPKTKTTTKSEPIEYLKIKLVDILISS